MSIDSPQEFRVVAIGSSSGGYDALKKFFKNLPDNPGMAFIVIQHISQEYKHISKELINQLTHMPVVDAVHGAPIEINTIYLTPRDKILSLEGERFQLNDKAKYIAISHHPIDMFFSALGHELKSRAVGIVLSGKGTDGSRGIRAIAEAGGTVLVQSPTTAMYSSMPEMAISSGYADLVMDVEEMPAKLKALSTLLDKNHQDRKDINVSSEVADIQNIIELLGNFSMVNFNHYKINSIVRRIEKRMSITGQQSAADYYRYLKVNAAELNTLYKNSLIGVTNFFRDPEAFHAFETQVIPEVCSQKDKYEQIRIWVPACATGEEAYTIALLLENYIQENKLSIDYKIFATDLDSSSLEFASLGHYSEEAIKDVPPAFVEKFFTNDDAFYVVSPDIRKKLIFVRHNLLRDPPFIRLDIISCRNLFIYLKTDVQRKITQVFHYALKPNGFLMLGVNEFLDEFNSGYDKVDVKCKIYRSKEGERLRSTLYEKDLNKPRLEYVTVQQEREKPAHLLQNDQEHIAELLLQEYAPNCVVVNKENQVIYLHGNVEKYIRLPRNRMSTTIYKLVDSNLSPIIRSGIRKLTNGEKSVLFKDVPIGDGKNEMSTNIHFKLLVDESSEQRLMLIEFGYVERSANKAIQVGEFQSGDFSQEYLNDLETEVKLTKKELQYTTQELEAAREELQASNEEMLSSNEELQSTNEELQSSNEELYSVNTELKRKVDELTILNNDINNLFLSTDIAIVFLDERLNIRKFTPSVNVQFNIREVDTGRPITELSQNFECKEFTKMLYKVLETGHPMEYEVKNKNKKYYIMRIIPYQVEGSTTSGVVLTFMDISDIKKINVQLKRMAKHLKRSESNLQSLVNNTPDIIVQYDTDLRYMFVTHSAEKMFNIKAEEVIGKSNAEVGLFEDGESKVLDEKLKKVMNTGQPDDFYTSIRFNKQDLYFYMTLVPERNDDNEIEGLLAIARDITPIKQAEVKLQTKNEELERINTYLDEFVYAIAHDLRTPVASLKNIVTLFKRADTQRKEDLLDLLGKSVSQLDRTLNGLIDIIDAQADGNNNSEVCYFEEVFADIRNELTEMITHADAEFVVNFEEAPTIYYIKSFLYSVMINLVSNAIKYREPDRKLKITISTRIAGNTCILLSVADNGIGIDLDKHGKQIFKPFKRFDTQTEGKGIGLHVIKNMVERNGGKIKVASTPGEGARFDVYLKEHLDA